MMRRFLRFIAIFMPALSTAAGILLVTSGSAFGQTAQGQTTGTDSAATLSITSDGEPLDVFDGRQFLGATPVNDNRFPPGWHVLHYILHQPGIWHRAAESESILVRPGDVVTRNVTPPVRRRISSEPFGAQIYAGDSLLGTTPSLLYLDRGVRTLRLEKPGYEEQTTPLTPDSSGEIHAVLIPRPDAAGHGNPGEMPGFLNNTDHNNNIPVYATGGVAVISGFIAAWSKIKADNFYDQYRVSGSAGTLSKVHSYDAVSGISMALSEVGFSVFTYLLLTR